MIPVRQSTAFECAIGPVLDADGVAVTDCVVGDFKIKKTTGNFAALNGSATLTHVSAGMYDLVLTTSDLDTVGLNCVAIDDTTNACSPIYLQVVEEAVYDAMFAASAVGPLLANSDGSGLTEAGGTGDHLTALALSATGLDAISQSATGMVEIAKAVWDRVLTGATHNIVNSSGRRLRQVDAAAVIDAGTAQAGSSTSITLAATASSTNDIYKGDRVEIIGGTGLGENGIITAYNGTTKVATVTPAFVITPDNTSEYQVVPATSTVVSWNGTAVTGDGDWSELQTDVDTILNRTGYHLNKVWFSSGGASGTTLGTNGTFDNPSSSWSDAHTLADQVGKAIRVKTHGAANSVSFVSSVDLSDLDVDFNDHIISVSSPTWNGSRIRNARIVSLSGSHLVRNTWLEDCFIVDDPLVVDVEDATTQASGCIRTGIANITLSDMVAGTPIHFIECYASIPATASTVNYTDPATVACVVKFTRHCGDLEFTNFPNAAHTIFVTGSGAVTIAASCLGGTLYYGPGITVTNNGSMTATPIGVGAELAKVPKSDSNVTWNATALASINTQVDNALNDIHLDHLLAADYDPASKPGVSTALLNELVQNDSGTSRLNVNVHQINLSTLAAVRLALSAGQIIPFTVDTATNGHTPTTTEFQADDITEATADHYNGRLVLWTTGNLAGQVTDVTDYSAVGGIGQFTVTAMTEAPANNDTGVLV